MSVLHYYSDLFNYPMVKQREPYKEVETVYAGKPILDDAVTVTLAEYDPDTKNAITAHHLKDYRRKVYNLVLLPKIDTLFDKVLEGSPYWNELLHAKSNFN